MADGRVGIADEGAGGRVMAFDPADGLGNEPGFAVGGNFVEEIEAGEFPSFAAVALGGFWRGFGEHDAAAGPRFDAHHQAKDNDGGALVKVVGGEHP